MTLRLNGSTSGYTEIDAPAVAGSNTLVLPTGNGTSGQVLTTNGSGALGWSSNVVLSAGSVSAPSLYISGSTGTGMWSPAADTLAWSTGGAERLRINNGGQLFIGTSATYGNSQRLKVQFTGSSTEYGVGLDALSLATGMTWIDFTSASGTVRGSVSWNGSAVAFNTSSDYRLKENIKPLVDASSRLLALKPCQYNFIEFPQKTVEGFIAHEAQAVVPECVTGEKDAVDDDGNPVYQGIDQSKLVPLLTAALQEAIARIETLETRLSALEVTL